MAFQAWKNYSIIKIIQHEDTPLTEPDDHLDDSHHSEDSDEYHHSFGRDSDQ
jgi:hypothetical protein